MPEYRKSPMPLDLKEGAVFVTDAHYPRHKDDFLALLDYLISSPPPQVFMLGDMFEFLCPYTPYTVQANKQAVEKIDTLSRKTELIYLEGNHDYLLKKLFPSTKVYALNEQPLILSYQDKTAAVMHGDKYAGGAYAAYTALIRNPIFILFLRFLTIDINGRFIKKLYAKLSQKQICGHKEGFAAKKLSLVKNYPLCDVNAIIEGHNHIRISEQAVNLQYEALAAFACNKSFFKVEFKQSDLCFVETSLGALKNEQA